jgi:translation initiation factor 2 beta subunit (eIF-2beta)/eIF-5
MRSFYQDRLGTNIGKQHSKTTAVSAGFNREEIDAASIDRYIAELKALCEGTYLIM